VACHSLMVMEHSPLFFHSRPMESQTNGIIVLVWLVGGVGVDPTLDLVIGRGHSCLCERLFDYKCKRLSHIPNVLRFQIKMWCLSYGHKALIMVFLTSAMDLLTCLTMAKCYFYFCKSTICDLEKF